MFYVFHNFCTAFGFFQGILSSRFLHFWNGNFMPEGNPESSIYCFDESRVEEMTKAALRFWKIIEKSRPPSNPVATVPAHPAAQDRMTPRLLRRDIPQTIWLLFPKGRTWGCGNPQAIASLKAGAAVLGLGRGDGFDCFPAAWPVGDQGLVIANEKRLGPACLLRRGSLFRTKY